jgi:hypothetical protein
VAPVAPGRCGGGALARLEPVARHRRVRRRFDGGEHKLFAFCLDGARDGARDMSLSPVVLVPTAQLERCAVSGPFAAAAVVAKTVVAFIAAGEGSGTIRGGTVFRTEVDFSSQRETDSSGFSSGGVRSFGGHYMFVYDNKPFLVDCC